MLRKNLLRCFHRGQSVRSAHSLPSDVRVMICGGGVVGTSVAYHLADRGWKDVVLLEQEQLTCGTTWHSVGLVGQVRDSISATKMMGYSRSLYNELEKKHGIGFKNCGSVTVSQTKDRMMYLARNHAIAKAAGVETHIISPSEAVDKTDGLISAEDVKGGLWIPGDGCLTAPDLTMALSKEAVAKGVTIKEGVQVKSVNISNKRVKSVDTSHGTVNCDYFINCAGQWARELGMMSNPMVDIPLQAMQHFYIVSQSMGIDRMLPVIRDYDGLIYCREWNGGLLIGGFEEAGIPAFKDKIPDRFSFQLLPEDWNHFNTFLPSIMKRYPCMQTIDIRHMTNGPESFTPDGKWNIGLAPNVDNYYIAAGMNSMGVAGAGAIGRHVAELMTDGKTTVDLSSVDVKRHAPVYNNTHFLRTRGVEIMGRYKLHYPLEENESCRRLLLSPLHTTLEQSGACFGQDVAYEKPLWFQPNSVEPFNQYTTQKGTYEKPSWFDYVHEEYKALKDSVGLVDISSFSKIEISADKEGLSNILQNLCTNDISDKPGSLSETLMLNEFGGIECHCFVMPLAENCFMLISPTAEKTRVLAWLQRQLKNNEVSVRDVTSHFGGISLVGPKAQQLLSDLNVNIQENTSKIVDIGYTARTIVFRQAQTMNYQLYVPVETALQLYDRLMAAGEMYGIRNVGHFALRHLQVENFQPKWLTDFTDSSTPASCGMSHLVSCNENGPTQSATSQLVLAVVENFSPESDKWFWGGEPVYAEEDCIGSVSSIGYNHFSNSMYCLCNITAKEELKDLDISVTGQTYRARIVKKTENHDEGSIFRYEKAL